MKNLKELEQKYIELGKEIEALKKQVLDYCLGVNNYKLNSEEVMLSDIFLHGKYISKL